MSDTPEAPIRNEKGQFVSGVAPYRGGARPRAAVEFLNNKLTVEELYRMSVFQVHRELLKLILDPNTGSTARVSAIKEYNDRAMGKAPQQMRVTSKTDDVGYDTIDMSKLPMDVLQAISDARLKPGNA